MFAHLPLAIFNIQPAEMLLIGVVLLLLFGPRLPTVMRSLGKGITEFKKGIHETEEHIRRELEKPPEPDRQIEHTPVEHKLDEHKPADQHPA